LVGERTAELQKEIAERLITERALRDTQDKLQHFLSKSPAVLYSFRFESGSWLPAWVSDNYLKFTGYEVQDWYRHSPALPCVEAPDHERILASFEALLVKSQVSLQYRVHRKDHTVRWLRDDRQLFRDPDGRPVEIIGCWTDITEQRLLEEELRQSQKMESVGLLAGGIAHDFNNMLTVMRCHVDLLARSGTFAGDASESLRAIQASADRSANLTRQLLAFSRKQIMRPENLDLNELAGSLSKLLARTLGEDIAMNADYTPHLPEVYADCGMIEQVILNLAINARDAMPKGGQLKLSTAVREIDDAQARQHPESRAGRFVCLSVTDSGAGIAAEHLAHIFEPFFTTKQVGKGTGLGLATVYGIVKQHEGWIEVESSVGQGTTFRILLPVSHQKTENAVTKIPVPASRGGSETILVVEDEPALLSLVRVTLQRQGYRVFTAGSGLEALEAWSDRLHQIDLLLTDMVMPDGVTGVELAERLLAQKPELKTIYMSGYSAELNGQEAVVSRDVCFLPKPFGPHALTKLVRECLDGRKQANLLTHSTKTATGSQL
jgi:PAS domain S-box-containing protein